MPYDLTPELEQAILDTLHRPLQDGETHHSGNAARERELCELFAKLDAAQAFELGRRLDRNRADDPLAQAFQHRLISERRQRLRAFLADTRRRLATAKR